MAKTTAEFAAWLADPASVPVVLIQADYNGGTKYIGSIGITIGGNTYEPRLYSDFSITNRVSPLDYSSEIAFSDVEIRNNNGEIDSWLSLLWVNKGIRVYVGDASWTDLTNDFRLVFTGYIGNIDSKDRNTLSLTIRSPLNLINTSISSTVLGNYNYATLTPTYTNPNKDVLRPLVIGEVFNITPLLVYPNLLEYMVHDGAVEQIIEVRDNGVPVTFYTTAQGSDPAIQNAGCFRLAKTPTGTITCDVQGMKESRNSTGGVVASYSNSAPNIIGTLITKYGAGKSTVQVDWTQLASMNTSYPTNIGVYITDRFNLFTLCDDIARQCGLSLTCSRDGKITIVAPRLATSATITLTESEMLLDSLAISARSDVIAGVRMGYARNWTVQNNLLTGIYQEHKNWYAAESTESYSKDSTVATNYGIEDETPIDQTYLVNATQVDSLVATKLTANKTQRTTYKMTLKADYMHPETTSTLGLFVSSLPNSTVILNVPRFNLSSVYGVVIATTPNWFDKTIEIEVMV